MYRSAGPCRVTLAGALAVLAFGIGCGDSAAPEEAVEVHAIRLTVGHQVATVARGGVTADSLVIGLGDASLMAQLLGHSGELAPVPPAEYRIEIVPDDEAVVTFTSRTAFAGTLTGVAAGRARLAVCLLRTATEECEFGSRTAMVLPVRVEDPDSGDDGDTDDPGTGEGV